MPGSTVVVIAHGSRWAPANDAHREAVDGLARRLPGVEVTPAFLELAEPGIGEAIDAAAMAGPTRIVVLPHFLYPGRHVGQDIPAVVAEARARHPDVEMVLLDPSGSDPRLADLLATQLEAALDSPC